MNSYQEAAVTAINKQQIKLKEGSPAWVVGEQLKDIARAEPMAAELLQNDLKIPEMSIVNAEKKIKDYADHHKTGNFAFVSPKTSDGILRTFYGIPEQEKEPQREPAGIIDLASYF